VLPLKHSRCERQAPDNGRPFVQNMSEMQSYAALFTHPTCRLTERLEAHATNLEQMSAVIDRHVSDVLQVESRGRTGTYFESSRQLVVAKATSSAGVHHQGTVPYAGHDARRRLAFGVGRRPCRRRRATPAPPSVRGITSLELTDRKAAARMMQITVLVQYCEYCRCVQASPASKQRSELGFALSALQKASWHFALQGIDPSHALNYAPRFS
jgi:hypothetical protein